MARLEPGACVTDSKGLNDKMQHTMFCFTRQLANTSKTQKHQKRQSHVTRMRTVWLRRNDCSFKLLARNVGPLRLACFSAYADTLHARAALLAKVEHPRRSHAAFVRPLVSARADAALDFTNNCKNWTVSSDHLPPTSSSRTTERARPTQPVIDITSRDAGPLLLVPSLPKGQTRYVSKATCTPPKGNNPSATTSRRHAHLIELDAHRAGANLLQNKQQHRDLEP